MHKVWEEPNKNKTNIDFIYLFWFYLYLKFGLLQWDRPDGRKQLRLRARVRRAALVRSRRSLNWSLGDSWIGMARGDSDEDERASDASRPPLFRPSFWRYTEPSQMIGQLPGL